MQLLLPALIVIVIVLIAAIALALRCARAGSKQGQDIGQAPLGSVIKRQETESEKNRQISRLAHDLSNPLNAMLGLLHLIEANKLPQEEVLPTIRKIQNNARRQKEIINELRKLAYSKPAEPDTKQGGLR